MAVAHVSKYHLASPNPEVTTQCLSELETCRAVDASIARGLQSHRPVQLACWGYPNCRYAGCIIDLEQVISRRCKVKTSGLHPTCVYEDTCLTTSLALKVLHVANNHFVVISRSLVGARLIDGRLHDSVNVAPTPHTQ